MTAVIQRPTVRGYRAAMRWLYLTSVWIHVMAAMTWIGGMLLFVLAVMPWMRTLEESSRERYLRDFGRRFGRVMWTSFAVLAVTGTTILWLRGVTLTTLIDPRWRSTPFGHLVLVKITLFLAAALIGVVHSRQIAPRQARWLGRLSLVLGVAIVAIAVRLVR